MSESVPRAWRESRYRERLIASRCNSCGFTSYPPKAVCSRCRGTNMQEVELPRKGKLITYTIIRRPPTEFEDQDPFAVGIVELQNGVRVLSQLTDIELKDVHSGMKLEAVLRKYRQEGEAGLIIYGIKFRPLLPRDGKKESSRDAD